MAGELAFLITGDWLLNRIRESQPRFEIRTSLIPAPDSLHGSVSFAGGEYLAINRTSQNIDAAEKLVRFLVGAQTNHKFSSAVGSPTPANLQSGSLDTSGVEMLADTFRNQLKSSRMTPVHPKWVYIEELIEKAIEKAIYHKAAPTDALTEACTEIDRILSETK